MRLCYLLASLLMLPFALFGHGDIRGNHDELEKRFINKPMLVDKNYQEYLRSTDSWKQFSAVYPEWWVQFNESTGRPHRAMGKPIAIPVTGSPEQAALYFLNNQAGMFLPSGTTLRLTGTTSTEQHFQPNFTQYFQDKEILWSRATVKMTTDFRAILFGVDVYSDIQLSDKPVLDQQSAVVSATSGVDHIERVVVNPDLKILPIPHGKHNKFRLVYEVTVRTMSEEGIPSEYYTLVDANSGRILYRQNRVNHFANTDITMSGTLYPTHIYNPSQTFALPYVKMLLAGIPYNADANGQYNVVLSSSISATFSLEGPWARVYSGNAGTTVPSFTTNIDPGINNVTFDNNTTIRHISAFYHTNIVHDYLKQLIPTFTTMDNPLTVRVDRTDGNCNAFYDGSSINFYTTSNGCNALSQVADVVYHEYGHGITNQYWASNGLNFSNGGMGEGYSDIWAICITANPVIGIGFDDADPTVYIRNYDFNNGTPRKIYPQNIVGQVHGDGEIIAGAWYSTALNMNSLSGMAAIFAESHAGLANGPDGSEGQVYLDILIDALIADDNDADITNGTPNGTAIINGFAAHGITLLNTTSLTHTPVKSIGSYAPITLNATVGTSQFFWAFSQVRGAYQVNGTGAWIPFTMTNTGGSNYSTSIPGYPQGTIIGYYLGTEDIYGALSNITPTGADAAVNPKLPHFIMVGYNLLFTDDFDNNAGFWITGLPGDNAVTGLWEQNEPVATTQGSMVVQPGFQTTPGGQYCYITQADPGTGLGSYDVDGGKTSMQSPDIDMSSMNNPAIEYYRYYTNDQGATPGTDYWQVYISNDGVNYVPVEYTTTADHNWRRFVFRVTDYVPLSATISVRFVAEDANAGSLVEALMDDFSVYETQTTGIKENVSILTAGLNPNPANDLLLLNCVVSRDENFMVIISDAIGKEVYRNNVQFNAGTNQYSLPASQLANGMYQVSLSNAKGKKVLKFVISR